MQINKTWNMITVSQTYRLGKELGKTLLTIKEAIALRSNFELDDPEIEEFEATLTLEGYEPFCIVCENQSVKITYSDLSYSYSFDDFPKDEYNCYDWLKVIVDVIQKSLDKSQNLS